MIAIGKALIRQKQRLPHGMFLPWIDAEFGMTPRSAQRFMAVAERFGVKSDSLSHLKPEALYELAAPSTPEEVRAEVERRIQVGELVSASRRADPHLMTKGVIAIAVACWLLGWRSTPRTSRACG